MATQVAIAWSVPEGHEAEIETALDAVRAHIESDHPQVLAVRLLRQFAGSEPHRAYLWLEEYESLGAFSQLKGTPACDEVWRPIRALMIPGTHRQSVWSDVGKRHWSSRATG
ncbi:MAG TPA: antibiotic biosynthesis monooxygenase [Candidatus Limnocylindrales bacterium]|nr:antibiotic biosynthesis monooxygenase [Candidatus Limnocylindrales bacterium]